MTYEDIEKRFASADQTDPAYPILQHFVEYHAKYLAGKTDPIQGLRTLDAIRDDIQASDSYRIGRRL